jgi:hypothetical protein
MASKGGGKGGGKGYGKGWQRPGDWFCSACQAHNYATRTICFRCAAPKQPAAVVQQMSYNPYGAGPMMQAGDWPCGHCGGHNYASRMACFRCAAPKTVAVQGGAYAPVFQQFGRGMGSGGRGMGGGRAGGRGGFHVYEPRPGDWNCGHCGAHNFATRSACYKCFAAKGQEPHPQTFSGTPHAGVGGFGGFPPSSANAGFSPPAQESYGGFNAPAAPPAPAPPPEPPTPPQGQTEVVQENGAGGNFPNIFGNLGK